MAAYIAPEKCIEVHGVIYQDAKNIYFNWHILTNLSALYEAQINLCEAVSALFLAMLIWFLQKMTPTYFCLYIGWKKVNYFVTNCKI